MPYAHSLLFIYKKLIQMIKHFIYTAIIVAIIITLVGCSNSEKKEIAQVALGYIDATSKFDFDAAEQYATKQTSEVTLKHLRLLQRFIDSSALENAKQAEFEVKNVEITSDTTAIAIYHKETKTNDYTDTLNMIKEDGAWKVDLVIEIPPIMQIFTDTTLWNKNGSLPNKDEVRKMKRGQK